MSTVEFEDSKEVAKQEEFYELSTRYELPALEPFVCKDFEDLGFSEDVKKGGKKAVKQPSEEKTLINFESPLQEEAKDVGVQPSKSKSILDDRNIVFAMCSSLREATDVGESSCSGSKSLSTSITRQADLKPQLSVEGQDSDYKSLELEVDESAMFNSQLPASSASDEETSNSNNDDQEEEAKPSSSSLDKLSQGDDEDEELQPLISSNKTSSSSLSTTVIGPLVVGGLADSLSGSMTTSGIVAAVGSSAKTPSSTKTTSALPTTEANQSEDSGKQTATAKQTTAGNGNGGGGNNGNGKKKSKKKRK